MKRAGFASRLRIVAHDEKGKHETFSILPGEMPMVDGAFLTAVDPSLHQRSWNLSPTNEHIFYVLVVPTYLE